MSTRSQTSLRPAPSRLRVSVAASLAAAFPAILSIALAGGIVLSPTVAMGAFLVAAAAVLGIFIERIGPPVVVGVLLYLPLQDFVLKYLSGAPLLAARYGPELFLDAVLLVLVLTRLSFIAQRLGKVGAGLALLVTFWICTAALNQVDASTMLIGLRNELRFVPLLIIPLLSANVRRDARRYARVIVLAGALQAGLALFQYVGGEAVRSWFISSYQVSLGDVVVGRVDVSSRDIVGTFSHRNFLGVYLAFAWIVLASAGAKELGFSRRNGLIIGWALVIATLLSTSREGAIAILVAALLIGRKRFQWPLARLAGATVLVLFVVVASTPGLSQSSLATTSLVGRWTALVNPSNFIAKGENNFRLFFLASSARTTIQESPVYGLGLGVASDPRLLTDRSSPIFRTVSGYDPSYIAAFIYDSNWAFLLLEVGFGGLLVLLWVLLLLYKMGRDLKDHWLGTVLSSCVVAVVTLGFFGPVLQQRAPTAIFWVIAGLAIALAAAPREQTP